MRLFYSPEYVLATAEFDTTRKAAWVAASLLERPVPGVELVAPAPLAAEDVALVHDPAYVDAVMTGVATNGRSPSCSRAGMRATQMGVATRSRCIAPPSRPLRRTHRSLAEATRTAGVIATLGPPAPCATVGGDLARASTFGEKRLIRIA